MMLLHNAMLTILLDVTVWVDDVL